MGMSTHVVGFKLADEKWKKMKAVYDTCKAAGVPPPKAVSDFFGDDAPDPNGVEVGQHALVKCGAVVEYQADSSHGFEVHIDKLPPDVKIVRVYNAW